MDTVLPWRGGVPSPHARLWLMDIRARDTGGSLESVAARGSAASRVLGALSLCESQLHLLENMRPRQEKPGVPDGC